MQSVYLGIFKIGEYVGAVSSSLQFFVSDWRLKFQRKKCKTISF